MINTPRCMFAILVVAGLLSAAWPVQAREASAPKYLFKVASLAPEGSIWAKRFQKFAQEVTRQTNGEVAFKIYTGGVMGDDRAVYRKMKIGQLHGGGFTMTGIGEVVADFRVMGVPFLFDSYEEVDSVRERLMPRFKQAFAEKNLALLAISEVGFIHAMSTEPIATAADLRRGKSWVPEGDPVSAAYLETAGVTPLALSIPDVLTSLQTGLINTVFNSYYGALVLQWFTRTRFILDIPFAYGYGAFVLDQQAFSRLPADYARLLEKTASAHFADLLKDTRESNAAALTAMKENGSTLVPATPAARREFVGFRDKTVSKLNGTAFSKEIYEEEVAALATFRQGKGR